MRNKVLYLFILLVFILIFGVSLAQINKIYLINTSVLVKPVWEPPSGPLFLIV